MYGRSISFFPSLTFSPSIPFSLSLLSLSLYFSFSFTRSLARYTFRPILSPPPFFLTLSLTLSSLLLTHVRVCGLSRYTAIVSIDACAARLYARANLPCADRRLSINGLVVQRNISPYPERACWKNDNSLFDGNRPAFLSLSLYRRRIVFSIFSFPLSLPLFFPFSPHFTDLTPHSCFFLPFSVRFFFSRMVFSRDTGLAIFALGFRISVKRRIAHEGRQVHERTH